MSAPRDLDRQLESFLTEGPMELPEPSYARVRDRIELKRQRADLGLWRTSRMNRYLEYGLAAAVVVAIAVVAINLLPGSPGPGTEPSATPEASEAPASAEPSSSGDASLPVGPHVMVATVGANEDRFTVTIPAPGWVAEPDEASVTKDLGEFGLVTISLIPGDHYRVPRNICTWRTGDDYRIAGTLDELVAYLTEQTYDLDGSLTRDFFTPPTAITVDGFPGQLIHDLAAEYPDSDPAGCDEQRFCTLLDRDGAQCLLSHSEPGALDTLWIVDSAPMNPQFRIVAASGWPNVEFRPEMRSLVESMTFPR